MRLLLKEKQLSINAFPDTQTWFALSENMNNCNLAYLEEILFVSMISEFGGGLLDAYDVFFAICANTKGQELHIRFIIQ